MSAVDIVSLHSVPKRTMLHMKELESIFKGRSYR
ncbi:hypothetical protein ACUXA5_000366 [Corynebacterium hesseae]